MTKISGKRLYKSLSWRLSWIGRTQALALAIVVSCITCVLLAMGHIGDMEQQAASARRRAGQWALHARLPVSATDISHGSAQSLYVGLPSADASANSVAEIMELIQRYELQAERGQYAISYDKSGKLAYYQITLPVRGNYRTIRQFINQALHDLPSLALDRVSFSRSKIDDAAVDAQLRLTLVTLRPYGKP